MKAIKIGEDIHIFYRVHGINYHTLASKVFGIYYDGEVTVIAALDKNIYIPHNSDKPDIALRDHNRIVELLQELLDGVAS